MRHRWPILAAILFLALGGTAPAAAAASAAGPVGALVQPGGLVGQLTAPLPAAPGAQAAESSTNWAGYVATGGPFRSVSASWVLPAVPCGTADQDTAFWVGFDGYANKTVEQTGGEVDCADGVAEYYAWYEMYPGSPVTFGDTVGAGDHLAGSVAYAGGGQFRITLADSTQGWSHTVTQTLAAATRSSAEILVEAPCCTAAGGIFPLTGFGSVSFTGATVNGAGLCDSSPADITMADVTVSPITACRDFTVSGGL